ncbi:MAG TPA: peptidoglycan-associated lipoprotein Pal [Gemmatimonadota bacterium]|nr:peptidoglycan-associated lipoprotein Pal [Gemmatimonadota bacterium]
MRRSLRLSPLLVLAAAALIACGGNPPPQTGPQVNEDSLAAARRDSAARADSIARAREREAAASKLCDRALAAVTAGNYDQARSLYQQARSQYAGTQCGDRAGAELERLSAIETVAQRVHFEFDKSRITDEAAKVLQQKAEVLREYPQFQIQIQGNCDERGSNEYNLALGQRRAASARQYLVSLGISPDRLSTLSYGEERPIAEGHDEQAWAMNRRDDFVIQNLAQTIRSQ